MAVVRYTKNYDEYVKALRIMSIHTISPFENDSLNHHHDKTSLCEQTVSDESAALALKNVFFFLGLIFRYPDEAVYAEIRQKLEAFDGFFSEYGEGIPPLPRFSELQAEYVSLFVNNKGFVPALPYASFHMDQRQLMGRTYFKIKDILEESGFRLDASISELEDHLSILLESCSGLVGDLIEKKINPSKSRIAGSALLEITSCIKNYVDNFAEQVALHASMDFYRISSGALKNFIHDLDHIYEQVLGLNDEKNKPQG